MMISAKMGVITHHKYAKDTSDNMTYLFIISGAILFLMIAIIVIG